jgi:hypothetical protein
MRGLFFLLAVLVFAGCSSEDPVSVGADGADPESWFDGSYDGTDFILQRTSVPGPDGSMLAVDLVASRLVYDAQTQQLNVEVRVRNTSRTDLYAPASVGIGEFTPDSVLPLNANLRDESPQRWWYDYSKALGEDGVLRAGEESAGVLWILQLQGPESFSFMAVARFAPEPQRAILGGRVFTDLDRDGVADPGEPGGLGEVAISFPDGQRYVARPDTLGWWAVPVDMAGLYSVQWIHPPTLGFAPVCLTTPSPLQVLLTPGPDGLPTSFREANFGIDPEPCFATDRMPIVLSDVPVDELESDHWSLIDLVHAPVSAGTVELLVFTIGFSGCGPDHPLALAVQRPNPDRPEVMVATVIHDGRNELCDAWWSVTRTVDMGLLRRQWLEWTGQPGPRMLELHTPLGIHEFALR